ncbi:MAG: CD1871A family CXXC motif-containing protein [Eubacteriales bacterium]|nr:CD1871A family CXXC motif-containing protein [Eubacteriales bacterium]MDD4462537.1 CD1871A family CXXC motif-containing protein [Eubacteriales bacterium]
MTERQRSAATAGLLFIAVALMLTGFLRDEFGFVLRRAINICLECIGIG